MTEKSARKKYLEDPLRNKMYFDTDKKARTEEILKEYVCLIKLFLKTAEESDKGAKSAAAAKILLALTEPETFQINIYDLSYFRGAYIDTGESGSHAIRLIDHHLTLRLKQKDPMEFINNGQKRLQAIKDKYGAYLLEN